ncbi:hypothetical protein V5799_031505, partial [Amblyomma americanum]
MVPGGAFSLSASIGRSSGSNAGASSRARGGCETVTAQAKIEASKGRRLLSQDRGTTPSIASISERDSKIHAWRSFSAGSCNQCSAAHVRASKRSVKDGSEFQFSMLGNKSLSGTERSFQSLSASEQEIIPLRQGSKLSVHMRSPKASVTTVGYTCTVSPPSRNTLPGSPLRKPVLETKVNTKVTTTTVEAMPTAHARLAPPRPSSVSVKVSNEVLKSATDRRDGFHRRSVNFTDLPMLPQFPEVTKREDAASQRPEPKFEQLKPQDEIQRAEPKTLQPQQAKPQLGPPLIEAKGVAADSDTKLELKKASISELSEDAEAPQKGLPSTVSAGRSHSPKHHREFASGYAPSMALVLQDEPQEEAAPLAANLQPAPVDASPTKDVP